VDDVAVVAHLQQPAVLPCLVVADSAVHHGAATRYHSAQQQTFRAASCTGTVTRHDAANRLQASSCGTAQQHAVGLSRSVSRLSEVAPSCRFVAGSATAVVGECLARCFCFFDLPPAAGREACASDRCPKRMWMHVVISNPCKCLSALAKLTCRRCCALLNAHEWFLKRFIFRPGRHMRTNIALLMRLLLPLLFPFNAFRRAWGSAHRLTQSTLLPGQVSLLAIQFQNDCEFVVFLRRSNYHLQAHRILRLVSSLICATGGRRFSRRCDMLLTFCGPASIARGLRFRGLGTG